jgi:uncharacterized membrane protein
MERFQFHAGPLPSPETLDGYDQVVPGLAERIVRRWELEGDQRHALENKIANHQMRTQSRGQVIAAVIALIVVVGGIVLLSLGKSVLGFAAMLTPLALIATAFIWGEVKEGRQNGPQV